MTVNGNEICSIYLCTTHHLIMKIYSIYYCFENLRRDLDISKLHKKKKKNLESTVPSFHTVSCPKSQHFEKKSH